MALDHDVRWRPLIAVGRYLLLAMVLLRRRAGVWHRPIWGYVSGTDIARCSGYNSLLHAIIPPFKEHDTSSIPYLKE